MRAMTRLIMQVLVLVLSPLICSNFVASYQQIPIRWSRISNLHQFPLKSKSSSVEGDDADAGSLVEFGSHRRNPMWQKRSKRWILLVDDEEAIRKAVGQMLFDQGYQVTACADGSTALHIAVNGRNNSQQQGVPDVIVSDVRMPGGMDGLQLLQEIRSNDRLVHIPVILLTAKGQTGDRIAGYHAGADAYIPKPFDPEELVAVIDSVIDRQEELISSSVCLEDLQRDLQEIKTMLLKQGGGGVGNGWVEATRVFLAPDEREVLELLCEGLRTKEIAEKTFLSARRVEQLLTSLFRKTKVKNRTELIRWAVSSGNAQM
jgi:DNA-binding NarL/FixJ family response regulator